jgi:DNA repair protein RadC
VLPLDESRRTLAAPALVSLGTETTTAIQSKDVFVEAFKVGATSIVIAHNHPSGDATPSIQDKMLTSSVSRLGESLGIRVLDHLILA